MNQRISKLVTMLKNFYLSDEIDGLYVPRKEGLDSIEDSLDASIQRLEENIKKSNWFGFFV